jgi:hypothetical protein
MAAMKIFGRSVDSDTVAEVLPVASPQTQHAVQEFLADGKPLTRLAAHELDGLLAGYIPESAN